MGNFISVIIRLKDYGFNFGAWFFYIMPKRILWQCPPVIIPTYAHDSDTRCKGRLTLPASLMAAEPCAHFQAEFDPRGRRGGLRRISKNANWLNVLKSCPVKIDDLPPYRREYPECLKLWVGFDERPPGSRFSIHSRRPTPDYPLPLSAVVRSC